MASTFENLAGAAYLPMMAETVTDIDHEIYEANRQRIYALSFWMTDNELAAEELLELTFRRAFAAGHCPSEEMLDEALIAELREFMSLGALTLHCGLCNEVAGVRHNTLRTHLERAVVQLPPTERMVFLLHDGESYSFARIGRYLGLAERECRYALHQARLRIRELLAAMTA